jgi:hypothetical protein
VLRIIVRGMVKLKAKITFLIPNIPITLMASTLKKKKIIK